MKVTNIHSSWGSIIEFDDPMEVFNYDRAHWRKMIYERQLLVFKHMTFELKDYAHFGRLFGRPWRGYEYRTTLEIPVGVRDADGSVVHVSEFSNKLIKTIGDEEMMWHADIPNKVANPFPHRALWIVKNPNGHVSGKTRWLNIMLDECERHLRPDQLALLDRVKIVQQSWYRPGTEIGTHDFIKTHPVTGKRSLRLNAYCRPNWDNLWIKGVVIDGVPQEDCSLIGDFISTLVEIPELHYEHTWEYKDIVIYDNWSFMHGRSKIIVNDGDDNERKFYRTNIDHLPD